MTAFYLIHFSSTFSRVASSLLFFRVLSLLVVHKLSDLSLMCGNEIDWDFLYSSVHEYEIVDSVVFSKSVALHKSSS